MGTLTKRLGFSLSAIALAFSAAQVQAADNLAEAIEQGHTTLDFRLRYETVDQDNALQDADALTLRTRLTYESAANNGFSFVVEAEDVRSVLGIDDYSVPPTGFNPGVYSVIADPDSTELDQAYVQYSNVKTTVRAGRQVIALDNQRHVGHVGWRQDRQTFDALSVVHRYNKEFTTRYYFINQRNRIFADELDVDSEDHLINISYKSDIGTFTGYAYLLEIDNNTDNSLDTYGIRLDGDKKLDSMKLFYQLEFATQENQVLGSEADANYWLLEAGLGIRKHKLTLGLENMGSDDGIYGFSTPLATLHKFNGWTDQFLATPANGLQSLYFKLQGKLLEGKYHLAWYDFSADEDAPGLSDYGSELELQYTYDFSKNYTVGLKYSTYSADDLGVDTDKAWVWLDAKF